MIDCKGDQTAKICKEMNVRGYPSLILYDGEYQYDFKGKRDLTDLEEFAVAGGYKNEEKYTKREILEK